MPIPYRLTEGAQEILSELLSRGKKGVSRDRLLDLLSVYVPGDFSPAQITETVGDAMLAALKAAGVVRVKETPEGGVFTHSKYDEIQIGCDG